MSAIINPVTSNMRAGAYGATWGSVYDIELEPQVWREWYQAYGKGMQVFDALMLAGQTLSVKARTLYSMTDQAIEKAVQLNQAGLSHADHIAGASRTFVLAATEYDEPDATACSPYLRQFDTIFMDPQYTNKDVPTQWFVTDVGADSANTTIYPLDATVQMTSSMAASTYLMVGGNLGGIGTGQPTPLHSGTTRDTFYTAILANTAEIKGGVNAEKLYRNDRDKSGRNTLWSKAQVEMEFIHNSHIDKEIMFGQVNTNTGNAVRTDGSANQAVRGTQGLWHWIEADGMEQAYAGSYDLAYFDQLKEYLRSQGVTDAAVALMAGSNLHKQIENTVLDYIKAYSGGTNLVEPYGSVGLNVQEFTKNGITVQLSEMVSWDNPNTYAVLDTYLRDAGLVIPKSLATVSSSQLDLSDFYGYSAGDKVSVPNLCIGYLNNNGENRTRMIGPVAGVNGFGYPFTNQYDKVEMFIKSEFLVFVALQNQMLKIVKEGTF